MATAVRNGAFAARTGRLRASTIREMLKVTQNADVISFAGGLPAPELFPVAEIAAAAGRVAAGYGAAALQYSVTEGIAELRRWVADRLNVRGGTAFVPDDVLIVGGSQQALDLYAKIYLDPGDAVVVENPSYLGAIQAFNAYEASYVTVDTDADGMIPAALESTLAGLDRPPKFLYLTPNFQNPTGITLAAERRAAINAICDRYDVPIFEDDPYGDLCFEESPLPPLISLPHRMPNVYAGTGSKMVAPGLRVAWIVVPDEAVREKLIPAKQAVDLHTGSYAQYVFWEFIRNGSTLDRHLATIRGVYAHRRDVMHAALAEMMPSVVQYTVPRGGMFFWATIAGVDTDELFARAMRENVAFVPGRPFYPHHDRNDGLRLNFSNSPDDAIRTGIGRLAHAIEHLLAGR